MFLRLLDKVSNYFDEVNKDREEKINKLYGENEEVMKNVEKHFEKMNEEFLKERKRWDELFNNDTDNKIQCSECLVYNDKENKYCVSCGHKLKQIPKGDKSNKNYCHICGEQVDENTEYCKTYGHKIEKNGSRICSICGEWISGERYCWNCGHDTFNRSNIGIDEKVKGYFYPVKRTKKCVNCDGVRGKFRGYPEFFHYCEDCGEKLVRK